MPITTNLLLAATTWYADTHSGSSCLFIARWALAYRFLREVPVLVSYHQDSPARLPLILTVPCAVHQGADFGVMQFSQRTMNRRSQLVTWEPADLPNPRQWFKVSSSTPPDSIELLADVQEGHDPRVILHHSYNATAPNANSELSCPRPAGPWCMYAGQEYTFEDCDGDLIPDHRCIFVSTNGAVLSEGYISSSSGCSSTWPTGQCLSGKSNSVRAVTTHFQPAYDGDFIFELDAPQHTAQLWMSSPETDLIDAPIVSTAQDSGWVSNSSAVRLTKDTLVKLDVWYTQAAPDTNAGRPRNLFLAGRWLKYGDAENSRAFVVLENKMSWDDAESTCQQYGGHLLSIKSANMVS